MASRCQVRRQQRLASLPLVLQNHVRGDILSSTQPIHEIQTDSESAEKMALDEIV